ncbi:hypothetical protein BAUCODRAFT_30183 [Baudoinia panamericana UAMH 10762]|uniref:NmrA-like domain-containing protein n=1 Tax=Baudoinia panamericana (strain UAMH 10762) TaxID=717646 RepID=M2NKV9_BAUPA|nr:uncharacterized protein BAUCODRAFT_30183 [Baudoinia panamericana UAMH 10762]EMC99780.1 hypothetical protein BAUCODRAFT_30183 [Baudoinia panamericana UAMH 10762]
MGKLIVVCGATGQVGGSIARRMLKEGWKVRAITRNQQGAAAKALAAEGAELESADFDDVASLTKAFKGANAVFGLTQFWDYILQLGQKGAGEKEYQQMLNIATAAQHTEGLEHFILHSLPAGEKVTDGKAFCAHTDYKDHAVDEMKKSMPELMKKTTFLWMGFFSSNLWTMLRPVEIPHTYGGHVWLQACPADTVMWVSDVENNVGLTVKYILEKPQISTPAKVICTPVEKVTMADVLKTWTEVSGKRAEYISISEKNAAGIFGIHGQEIADQFKWNSMETDWAKGYHADFVPVEELGIPKNEILSLKQSFEANKEKL